MREFEALGEIMFGRPGLSEVWAMLSRSRGAFDGEPTGVL
jgi:hypothetical protein